MILIIYFICFLNLNQDDWKTYYADKKVEISFKSQLCDDRKNGFAFEKSDIFQPHEENYNNSFNITVFRKLKC